MELALLAVGFAAGLLTGRWWSLLLAIALGVWVGTTAEVEIDHAFLGAAYGLVAAAGIAFGVLLSPRRRPRPRRDV